MFGGDGFKSHCFQLLLLRRIIMTKQQIINRIELLKTRKEANGNIIKKLERRLRKMGENV